jgi:predicted nucleic acid-binding protein
MAATSFTIEMNRFTFDTNVLIYSVDLRSPEKHDIAKRLVRLCGESGWGVPLQCLSEFYRATTRKHILSLSAAFDVVEETRNAMRVIPPASKDLLTAMQFHELHKIPFFDGLLLSTVARAGYTTLFTEDFQDGRILSGVTFRNPFAPGFNLDEVLRG